MNPIISIVLFSLIFIGCLSLLVNTYNKLVLLKNNIDKAFANIDVLLLQRAEEIPTLVSVVKGSMQYEKQMLEELTQMRSQFLQSKRTDEKVGLSNSMSQKIQQVFVIAESYPDLKANQALLQLQQRITELENHLADRREFFNDSVNLYNISIREFPTLIMAGLLRYRTRTMLTFTEDKKQYHGVEL